METVSTVIVLFVMLVLGQ